MGASAVPEVSAVFTASGLDFRNAGTYLNDVK